MRWNDLCLHLSSTVGHFIQLRFVAVFCWWIVFAPLVNKATWAAAATAGTGGFSGETPPNSEVKTNGINKSHLVDGWPRVRPLISLLLKLPLNALCDATREKCRVNWCHAPVADITSYLYFSIFFFWLTLAENMSRVWRAAGILGSENAK